MEKRFLGKRIINLGNVRIAVLWKNDQYDPQKETHRIDERGVGQDLEDLLGTALPSGA